jgi:hypothetical protein
MADPLGAASSIVGIVGFGLQLATTLQTFMELTAEAQEALHDIVFDVNATASALKQLQDIISADKATAEQHDKPPVFKDAGLREIQALAIKCEKIYKTIIVLIHKASDSDKAKRKDDGGGGGELAIDPTALKPMTLLRKLRWPWLAPRVGRCQEQLRWLKMSLLLNLQLANLAQAQFRYVC